MNSHHLHILRNDECEGQSFKVMSTEAHTLPISLYIYLYIYVG